MSWCARKTSGRTLAPHTLATSATTPRNCSLLTTYWWSPHVLMFRLQPAGGRLKRCSMVCSRATTPRAVQTESSNSRGSKLYHEHPAPRKLRASPALLHRLCQRRHVHPPRSLADRLRRGGWTCDLPRGRQDCRARGAAAAATQGASPSVPNSTTTPRLTTRRPSPTPSRRFARRRTSRQPR